MFLNNLLTSLLPPESSFPQNFSLLATFRAKKGTRCFLLSVYDAQGVQQLGLEVGHSPVFWYQDRQGRPGPGLHPVFPEVNLADGK